MLDGTYSGLLASIAGLIHRSDLTASLPDFVILAEARIARDLRLRRQITTTTLATVAGVQNVTLPADYLELENLSLTSGGIDRNLLYVNIEHMNTRFQRGADTATPRVYTLETNTVVFGPVPDAAYPVVALYYARFSPLAATPANWLLTNHPDVYLFGALAEAADFIDSEKMAQKWEAKYARAVKQLQVADDKSMFSGAALRVRSINNGA